MAFEQCTLSNGIRVAHLRTNSTVAYSCVMVNAGTRDELENEHGLAHFIEHVLFKGTKRRKSYHIMSRMEDVGGELNAYTTKEETVIHTTCLRSDFSRSVELLSDIFFQSTFPEREIVKEKEVIIDEINSYKDSPSELIFDDFEDQVYQGHPFGRSILGEKRQIRRFTRNHIKQFIKRNYLTHSIIFCSIGNVPFGRVRRLAERHFGDIPISPEQAGRFPISTYNPTEKVMRKRTFQHHCVLGCPTYSLVHPRRVGMHLLNNLLGGPGLNSRLNLSLRERNGYAYNVESSYLPYSDTGIFCIYFGSEKENFERSFELVHKELEKLRTNKLGVMQLHKAKRQLMGQLAISSENSEVLMLNAARNILVNNSTDSLKDVYSEIESISADELMAIANEVLQPSNISSLSYK